MTTMASVPFHFVASAHSSDTLVLLSANAIHVVSPSNPARHITLPTSVIVPQATKPDQSDAQRHAALHQITFPRIAAFSRSDRYLAITGDDKILRVFQVDASDTTSSFAGLAQGNEVLIKALPKRAAILRWLQPNQGQEAEELVVVDKFGDLRSFQLDPSSIVHHVASASAAAAAAAAVTDVSAATMQGAGGQEKDDEMDRPTDPSMKILMGHVSMITDIAFTPQPSASSQPRFLLTADRDEHIRISRWGPRRAAHVIERFLLGSSAFVGSLCIVEDSQAEGGRYKLVASDGGKALRVWSLPEAEAEAGPSSETLPSSKACLSINSIEAAIASHIVAREREEKRRENRGYNPEGKRGRNVANKRKKNDDQNGEAAEVHTEVEADKQPNAYEYNNETQPTKAITAVRHFRDSTGKGWLLIAVEGSKAFFHLPLSAVLAPASEVRDLSEQVQATVLPAPILDLCSRLSADGYLDSVWATLDVRPEFQPRDATMAPPPALQQLVFNASTVAFEAQPSPVLVLTETSLEPFMLSALALYPALTNWPKVDAPSSAEMLASRIKQKGRPTNGMLTDAADGSLGQGQQEGDAAAEGEEVGRRGGNKMVKRMQEGKRSRGREKNRAELGLLDAA